MCLFIMADRCHVRQALSLCQVSNTVFFLSLVIVLWTKARKLLLEDGMMGKVHGKQSGGKNGGNKG